jgi:hypothetical protein
MSSSDPRATDPSNEKCQEDEHSDKNASEAGSKEIFRVQEHHDRPTTK